MISHFHTEDDIVTYQNDMIICMWDSKETIIPEKQTGRKPEKNLSFTSKFGSPDWTMLITNPNSFSRVLFWTFQKAETLKAGNFLISRKTLTAPPLLC